jgi:hypothetical protein
MESRVVTPAAAEPPLPIPQPLPAPMPTPEPSRSAAVGVGGRWPLARAAVGGLLAGGLVLGLRAGGWLTGPLGIAVAIALTLAVPTSRALSRRIVLAGCVLLGWAQVLWWWRLPTGGAGRVTLVLALLAGALAGWVLMEPRRRARELLPRLRPVDALPWAAGALAVWLTAPWWSLRGPANALGVLVHSADTVEHFDIVGTMRAGGAVVRALGPAPDGSARAFTAYPAAFHSVAATLVELACGPRAGIPAAELVRFVQASAALVVLGTIVVVAGLCSLPSVRRHPVLAVPAAAAVVAAAVVTPGDRLLLMGHAPFLVATLTLLAGLLVAVQVPRAVLPVHLLAAAGAVIGVAHSWPPLLALAVPATATALLPWQGRRRGSRRSRGVAAAGLVVAAVAAGSVVPILLSIDVPTVVALPGAAYSPPRWQVGAAAFPAVAACVLLVMPRLFPSRRGGGRRRRVADRQVAALAMCLVGGGLAYLVLLLAGLREGPGHTYYAKKMFAALLPVAVTVLTVAVVQLVDRPRPLSWPRSLTRPRFWPRPWPVADRSGAWRGGVGRRVPLRALAAATGAAAAFLVIGGIRPGWAVDTFGLPNSQAGYARHLAWTWSTARSPDSHQLLAAADAARAAARATGAEPVLVSPGSGMWPLQADRWLMALTGTWTLSRETAVLALTDHPPVADGAGMPLDLDPRHFHTDAQRVRALLADDPNRVVLVAPGMAADLRRHILDPSLDCRIRSWAPVASGPARQAPCRPVSRSPAPQTAPRAAPTPPAAA